uniref:Serine/threonine protein phosphatase 2A regulatory subunit n=1 Tax=Glossina brevipalpis TaxID=37001 RepID=A0A1A9WPI9_9MUSC
MTSRENSKRNDPFERFSPMKKMKKPQGQSRYLHSASEELEPLPNLNSNINSRKQEGLFISKLRQCCVLFHFETPNIDSEGKQIKCKALKNIIYYLTYGCNVLTEAIYPEIVHMFACNIFHTLPPSEFIDIDPKETIFENSWVHINLVYDAFLSFLESPDFQSFFAVPYINEKFIIQLLKLFDSINRVERQLLKIILHRIYHSCISLREIIKREVKYVLIGFINGTEHLNGINDILNFMESLIIGFAVPLKTQYKEFAIKVLVPLHKKENLPSFYEQLAACMIPLIKKEPMLCRPVIGGLLRIWPKSSARKETIYLSEIEVMHQEITLLDFYRIQKPLFRQISKCVSSSHYQVAKHALNFCRNKYVVSLIMQNCDDIMPLIVPAVNNISKHYWNKTILLLSRTVLIKFQRMNPGLFHELIQSEIEELARRAQRMRQAQLQQQQLELQQQQRENSEQLQQEHLPQVQLEQQHHDGHMHEQEQSKQYQQQQLEQENQQYQEQTHQQAQQEEQHHMQHCLQEQIERQDEQQQPVQSKQYQQQQLEEQNQQKEEQTRQRGHARAQHEEQRPDQQKQHEEEQMQQQQQQQEQRKEVPQELREQQHQHEKIQQQEQQGHQEKSELSQQWKFEQRKQQEEQKQIGQHEEVQEHGNDHQQDQQKMQQKVQKQMQQKQQERQPYENREQQQTMQQQQQQEEQQKQQHQDQRQQIQRKEQQDLHHQLQDQEKAADLEQKQPDNEQELQKHHQNQQEQHQLQIEQQQPQLQAQEQHEQQHQPQDEQEVEEQEEGKLEKVFIDEIDPYNTCALKKRIKRKRTFNRYVNLRAIVLERLPPLKHKHAAIKQEQLLIRKLRQCCVSLDYLEPMADWKAKIIKYETLSELSIYITRGRGVLTRTIYPEMINMVSCNIFRTLPPRDYTDLDNDVNFPTIDAAWPSLQLVYDVFASFLYSKAFRGNIAENFISEKFIIELLDLFDSEDERERVLLKTILHRIYSNCMNLREFIKKQIKFVFLTFIYETKHLSGAGELLEVFASLVKGFGVPLKLEYKQFLLKVLLPMHKLKCLSLYHEKLSYCVLQFLQKDPMIAEPFIKGLLNIWPRNHSQKEAMFLVEINEILNVLVLPPFKSIQERLLIKLFRCLSSPHFLIARYARQIWNKKSTICALNQNNTIFISSVTLEEGNVEVINDLIKRYENMKRENAVEDVRKRFFQIKSNLVDEVKNLDEYEQRLEEENTHRDDTLSNEEDSGVLSDYTANTTASFNNSLLK